MVRFKNRHLIVQIMWKDRKIDTSVDEKVILTALRKSIVTNFGDVGGGLTSAALRVGFYSPLSNICVIRCGRDHKRQVNFSSTSTDRHCMSFTKLFWFL